MQPRPGFAFLLNPKALIIIVFLLYLSVSDSKLVYVTEK